MLIEIQSPKWDSTDLKMVDVPEDKNGVRPHPPSDVYVPVEYTRTLDKAYRFYKDSHVQEIRYHPMLSVPGYICIAAKVLPSMRNDRVCHVSIIIKEFIARVMCAYCACPAGLSGCCNHVTATLYCLEDYFHLGLHEDEKKGCTDRLQTWNQPRKRNVEARPTDDVKLTKEQYGVKKKLKILTIPTEQEHQRGCLEVKCPYVCEKLTFTDACRKVSAFCLVEYEGLMCLSESHCCAFPPLSSGAIKVSLYRYHCMSYGVVHSYLSLKIHFLRRGRRYLSNYTISP